MKKKFPVGMVISAFLLMVSCMFTAFMLKTYNTERFLIAIVPTIVFSAVLVTEIIIYYNSSLKHIAELNEAVSNASNQVLYYSENPVALLDSNYEILWCNREFDQRILSDDEAFGRDIQKTFGIDMETLTVDGVSTLEYRGHMYKVTCVPVTGRQKNMIYLSFSDITEFAQLLNRFKRTRPVVVLLVIDNYEDVLQNFRESEKAHVSAAIETLLEDFMSNTSGVIRKLSNDKFIAFIEEQHLTEIINAKFNILDKARSISVNDRNNIVTFSIGVGRGGDTFEENENLARQALDMCLGRGGDQAAVKTESGFRFFGGVAKGVEKKSKAKSRIIANALQELVNTSENVYIMGHRFADLDAVGAGTSMAYAIRKLGKQAYFVIDKQKNLSHMLIDKISEEYSDIIISPSEAAADQTPNNLLIIVDTHNPELVESKELLDDAHQKVVIDHHRKSVNFINDAVIFYHEPYSSSASEMVAEIIQYFKGVESIPSVFAEALLSGIMLDTKNFVMHTGVRTFEAAAYLRKNGADTIRVKSLFTSSIENYSKRAALISSAQIVGRCAIALSYDESDEVRVIAPQAADELLGIRDVDASFVIYKTGGVVNISARSLGNINVQIIMERLGGGGHQTMAAAQLRDITEQQAKDMLIEAINADQGE